VSDIARLFYYCVTAVQSNFSSFERLLFQFIMWHTYLQCSFKESSDSTFSFQTTFFFTKCLSRTKVQQKWRVDSPVVVSGFTGWIQREGKMCGESVLHVQSARRISGKGNSCMEERTVLSLQFPITIITIVRTHNLRFPLTS